MREAALDNWRQINHRVYDGNAENCFSQTSVHLSFTEYVMSLKLDNEITHMIDRLVNIVETLVQVLDRGHWVADLDVLGALDSDIVRSTCKIQTGCRGGGHVPDSAYKKRSIKGVGTELIAIDTWEELLDPPKKGFIITGAHGNWLARLAIRAVCRELGFKIVVLPKDNCWSCCNGAIIHVLRSCKKRYALRNSKSQKSSPPTEIEIVSNRTKNGEWKLALIQ